MLRQKGASGSWIQLNTHVATLRLQPPLNVRRVRVF